MGIQLEGNEHADGCKGVSWVGMQLGGMSMHSCGFGVGFRIGQEYNWVGLAGGVRVGFGVGWVWSWVGCACRCLPVHVWLGSGNSPVCRALKVQQEAGWPGSPLHAGLEKSTHAEVVNIGQNMGQCPPAGTTRHTEENGYGVTI